MNHPMVQYLRQALKNDAIVHEELDRLLSSSSFSMAFHPASQGKAIKVASNV